MNYTTRYRNIAERGPVTGNAVLLILILLTVLVSGCTAVRTFPRYAGPGDTVTLAIYWQPELSPSDLTVRVTDSLGNSTNIAGTDPSIRGWINGYPEA